MPWRRQIARTSRRFARLTGWPPPLLFVTVTMQSGMLLGPDLGDQRLELRRRPCSP